MSFAPPWHDRTLADGDWFRADFADLTLVILSTMEEWRVATVDPERRHELPKSGELPEDLPWQRWDRGPHDTDLHLMPVFPDRPIILRPRAPLHLSPRSKAIFYVGIPAWIQLCAEIEGTRQRIAAWPTVRLSNTWHGEPTKGELCYAAKTRARRKFITDEWEEFDIAATIEISNQSEKTLPFERLYFGTDHLAIFEHEGRIWSNHARVRAGEDDSELNGVVFSPKPYGDAASGVEISPARKGMVRRSFLKSAFSTVLGTLNDD